MTAALAAHDAVPAPRLDYALPGWAVDVIRDGVPSTDARRAWAAALSVAMSAQARGWTEAQYVNAVADTHSRLWAQLMVKRDGRRGSLPAAMKSLRKAWSTAGANIANVGVRDREDIAADAVERAYEWADRLDARTDGLSATETAVMGYVVRQTEQRGMLRVVAPGRDVAAECGIAHRSAVRVLASLVERGYLVKHSAGRSGEPGKGRAAIFALPVIGGERPVVAHRRGKSPYVPEVPAAPEVDAQTATDPAPESATEAPQAGRIPMCHASDQQLTVTATPAPTHDDAQGWVVAVADALTARGIDAAELPDAAWSELRRAYVDGEAPEVAAARLEPETPRQAL